MKIKAITLIMIFNMVVALTPFPAGSVSTASIKDYRIETVRLYAEDKKLARIAIRTFSKSGRLYYLAVNPVTLKTEIVPVGRYLTVKKSLADTRSEYGRLAYFRAMALAETTARRLQNAGITRVPVHDPAVFMTADLCPTKLQIDRIVFTRLVADYGPVRKPIPVALAVSGVWIEKHGDDLAWLLSLVKKKDLAVTWINHSYSHRYKKRVPWWRNFFLDKSVRVTDEILKNEMVMLEAGIVPSVFFRFPGLVSNKDIFTQVTDCGLIPIGSDAWLGKKQWPVYGSIILVHANGQEPIGIKRFLWLLDKKKSEIIAGRWVFSDLGEGLSRAMKMY